MKTYFLALSLATVSLSASAGCAALDYQEMKDMKPAELLKEYCKYSTRVAADQADADRQNVYAASLRRINESAFGVFDMQRNRDALQADQSAAAATESAQQCQSQMQRIARVLASAAPSSDAAPVCASPTR